MVFNYTDCHSALVCVCVCVWVCVCVREHDLVSVRVVDIVRGQRRDHRRFALTLDVHRQQHRLKREMEREK